MLGGFKLLELHQQAILANVGVQRIIRLHLPELLRRQERVRQRRTSRDRRKSASQADAAEATGRRCHDLFGSNFSSAQSADLSVPRAGSPVRQALVPVDGPGNSIREPQPRRPAEPRARARSIDLQAGALMRCIARYVEPCRAIAPLLHDARCEPCDWPSILVRWTEIPGLAEAGGVRMQPFGQQQVAAQRFQHVLPRTNGVRIANRRWPRLARSAFMQSGSSRSSAQSPPPITLPARAVATPTTPLPWIGEERAPVRRCHQFGAALGTAVGIMAAHRLDLAIGPRPFAVLVALVAGHDDHAADRWSTCGQPPARAPSP